jgi:hypothetical protein
MWILTSLARACRELPALDFAEFGAYRGGCAYMLLSMGAVPAQGRLHLFDTFSGIPPDQLSLREIQSGIGGRYRDASIMELRNRLARWGRQVEVWPGDVLSNVPEPSIRALAFIHMDLNAAKPTEHVLPWSWSLLCPNGIMLFDDYGDDYFLDQRNVLEAFFARQGTELTALPTGQALAIKRDLPGVAAG